MTIFLIAVATILIVVFFARNIEKNKLQKQKNILQKKEDFKNKIKNFTIKFLQPLVNDDEIYQLWSPIKSDKVKIYIKLLQEEFGNEYINSSDKDTVVLQTVQKIAIANTTEVLKEIRSITNTELQESLALYNEIITLNYMPSNPTLLEIIDIINSKASEYFINDIGWTICDSEAFLNDLFFEILFKKFVKQFAIDNNDCVDNWESIIKCYVKTFNNNLDYLIYIKHYIEIKNINAPSNLETAICKYIEDLVLETQAKQYKNVMDNNKKIKNTDVTIENIDLMNGIEFENLLSKMFKKMNYTVELTKTTGDQGADLIIEKIGQRTVVQAKCYSSTVSNKAIQEAVASMNVYGANHAMVVTNNYFTKSAIELANSNNVELWDRDKLIEQLKLCPICID